MSASARRVQELFCVYCPGGLIGFGDALFRLGVRSQTSCASPALHRSVEKFQYRVRKLSDESVDQVDRPPRRTGTWLLPIVRPL